MTNGIIVHIPVKQLVGNVILVLGDSLTVRQGRKSKL